jgi:hypothetical protein
MDCSWWAWLFFEDLAREGTFHLEHNDTQIVPKLVLFVALLCINLPVSWVREQI